MKTFGNRRNCGGGDVGVPGLAHARTHTSPPVPAHLCTRFAMHDYRIRLAWTGNRGRGTADYRAYDRAHEITAPGKPPLAGSSDPAFRGDPTRYNPEELLVAALSACHMLWYLHLCADAGIVVSAYRDDARGTLETTREGGGRFTEVVLHPSVTLERGDPARAAALHDAAHRLCFIASSVNFPVRHEPRIEPAG